MAKVRNVVEGKRKPAKRMLAAGRKINGVWQVRTFLRSLTGDTRETFWEAGNKG